MDARMAALALHGLQDADREWILAQLAPGERARVTPLLAELGELGISKETARAQSRAAALRRPTTPVPTTPVERLRGASARDVSAVLAGEPAALVARCLRLSEWPWHAAVIARLGRDRRKDVADFLRDDGVKSNRAHALLLERLDARVEAERLARRRRGPAARLRHWMEARWTRR